MEKEAKEELNPTVRPSESVPPRRTQVGLEERLRDLKKIIQEGNRVRSSKETG